MMFDPSAGNLLLVFRRLLASCRYVLTVWSSKLTSGFLALALHVQHPATAYWECWRQAGIHPLRLGCAEACVRSFTRSLLAGINVCAWASNNEVASVAYAHAENIPAVIPLYACVCTVSWVREFVVGAFCFLLRLLCS